MNFSTTKKYIPPSSFNFWDGFRNLHDSNPVKTNLMEFGRLK